MSCLSPLTSLLSLSEDVSTYHCENCGRWFPDAHRRNYHKCFHIMSKKRRKSHSAPPRLLSPPPSYDGPTTPSSPLSAGYELRQSPEQYPIAGPSNVTASNISTPTSEASSLPSSPRDDADVFWLQARPRSPTADLRSATVSPVYLDTHPSPRARRQARSPEPYPAPQPRPQPQVEPLDPLDHLLRFDPFEDAQRRSRAAQPFPALGLRLPPPRAYPGLGRAPQYPVARHGDGPETHFAAPPLEYLTRSVPAFGPGGRAYDYAPYAHADWARPMRWPEEEGPFGLGYGGGYDRGFRYDVDFEVDHLPARARWFPWLLDPYLA